MGMGPFLPPHDGPPPTKVAVSRERRGSGELRFALAKNGNPTCTDIAARPLPAIIFSPIRSAWVLMRTTLTRPRRYALMAGQIGVTASRPR